MRSLRLTCIFAVLIASAGCASSRTIITRPLPAADDALARDRLVRFSRAYEAGDADAVRRCFAISNEIEAACVAAIGDAAAADARLRKAEARLWKPVSDDSVIMQRLHRRLLGGLGDMGFAALARGAGEPQDISVEPDGRVTAIIAVGCGSSLTLENVGGNWLIKPDSWYASPEMTAQLRKSSEEAITFANAIDRQTEEQLHAAVIKALVRRDFLVRMIRDDVRHEIGFAPARDLPSPGMP
jgi:hypothetical protein